MQPSLAAWRRSKYGSFHHVLCCCVKTPWQVVSHLEIYDWQNEFDANARRDHAEVIEYLAEIQNSQTITNELLGNQQQLLVGMMSVMQNVLTILFASCARYYANII